MGPMSHTIGFLWGTYRTDHGGDSPTAFRIHPADWEKLLGEVPANAVWLGPGLKFMGMVALIDPKWRKGFPVCLGPKGAAEAIEAGARQA